MWVSAKCRDRSDPETEDHLLKRAGLQLASCPHPWLPLDISLFWSPEMKEDRQHDDPHAGSVGEGQVAGSGGGEGRQRPHPPSFV